MLENDIFLIDEFSFINEEFYARKVSSVKLDALLEQGWRHFGSYFFRYNLALYEEEIRRVLPLRLRLADFSFSKSQRRNFKKNKDLQIFIRPIEIDKEKEILFERHKGRFRSGAPDSLCDFLSFDPANTPCHALEVCVYESGKLLAASFFDAGETAVSSIYGMFEPDASARGLGIFTMLLEIDFALENGKSFYYLGYTYEGNSFYDYKKRFRALEKFDWRGRWEAFSDD